MFDIHAAIDRLKTFTETSDDAALIADIKGLIDGIDQYLNGESVYMSDEEYIALTEQDTMSRDMRVLAFVSPVFDLGFSKDGEFLYIPTKTNAVDYHGYEWNYKEQMWVHAELFESYEDGLAWAKRRHDQLKKRLKITED